MNKNQQKEAGDGPYLKKKKTFDNEAPVLRWQCLSLDACLGLRVMLYSSYSNKLDSSCFRVVEAHLPAAHAKTVLGLILVVSISVAVNCETTFFSIRFTFAQSQTG
jgi:hypothetical protein